MILSTLVIRARRRRLRDKAAPHSADFSLPVCELLAFLLNLFPLFDFRWSRRDIFDEHTCMHSRIFWRLAPSRFAPRFALSAPTHDAELSVGW